MTAVNNLIYLETIDFSLLNWWVFRLVNTVVFKALHKHRPSTTHTIVRPISITETVTRCSCTKIRDPDTRTWLVKKLNKLNDVFIKKIAKLKISHIKALNTYSLLSTLISYLSLRSDSVAVHQNVHHKRKLNQVSTSNSYY